MRELSQHEVETGVTDDFYLEQTNKEIIDKLHSLSIAKEERFKKKRFCYLLINMIMEGLTYLTPLFEYLAYGSILILTFMNSLKLHNDFSYSISISLFTSLWVACLFQLLSLVRLATYSIILHRSFFSRIVLLKNHETNLMAVFQFFLYLIIFVSCVVSLNTFNDQCLKNYEECQHIWKILRFVFFNNN